MSIGRGTEFPFQVLGHHKVALGDFQFSPRSMPNSAPNPKLEGESLQGRDLRNSQIQGFELKPLLQACKRLKRQGKLMTFSPRGFHG